MTEILAWFGFCCAIVIGLALTVLIVSFLLHLIERSTIRWLPLFRVLYRFYQSVPSSGFSRHSRYFLALYDREELRFTHVEALNTSYENEEEHERAMDEMRQRLRKKPEVSE